MIINSPVGRFPFEVTGFRRDGSALVVEGRMGTWPTSIEVHTTDVMAVAARLRPQLALAGIGLAALVLLRGKRGSRSR
jgi:hypothetical protein